MLLALWRAAFHRPQTPLSLLGSRARCRSGIALTTVQPPTQVVACFPAIARAPRPKASRASRRLCAPSPVESLAKFLVPILRTFFTHVLGAEFYFFPTSVNALYALRTLMWVLAFGR